MIGLDGIWIVDAALLTGLLAYIGLSRKPTMVMDPKLIMQVHYAEQLREVNWFGRQDVVVEIELIDDVIIGRDSIKCESGGTAPRFTESLVIALPPDLSRLTLRARVYSEYLNRTQIAHAHLGSVLDLANGLPRDVPLEPQGHLTFSVSCDFVNLPIVVASPLPPGGSDAPFAWSPHY